MAWLFHKDIVENWAYAENIFTPEECKQIIDYANKKGTKRDATVLSKELKNMKDPAIRKNKVVWLNEEDNLPWMYERLTATVMSMNEKYFGFDLYGFCESVQFTEYGPKGDHYVTHMDKVLYGQSRKLSIVVQLTDPKDYKGGELHLFESEKPTIMTKQQGMMVAFPSYMLHKVTPVTKGMRHTLVCWIGGKNFK